jgi:hypothetical protein
MSRYSKSRAVTPSDAANIANDYVSDGVFIGGTGNAVLVLDDGSTVTLTGAAANTVWPFAIKRVNETGTTATGIRALKF